MTLLTDPNVTGLPDGVVQLEIFTLYLSALLSTKYLDVLPLQYNRLVSPPKFTGHTKFLCVTTVASSKCLHGLVVGLLEAINS